MTNPMPVSAFMLAHAFGEALDPPLTVAELRAPTNILSLCRIRASLWRALYDERDEAGRRRYSGKQIGEWFGVRKHTVSSAIKRLLDDEASAAR